MPLVRGAARGQATLANVSQLPCVRRDKEISPTGARILKGNEDLQDCSCATQPGGPSDLLPALQRTGESHRVCVLEVTAHWKSAP